METTSTLTRRPIKTHFDAVVHFFSVMDADMIFDLLDSKLLYQGFPRHVYARKLGDLFYDLKSMGDTKLVPLLDNALLPKDGDFGVTFEGDITNLYIDIVFEVDEVGYITDIYEISDIIDDDYASSKRRRVYIDQFVDLENDLSIDDDDPFNDGSEDDMLF